MFVGFWPKKKKEMPGDNLRKLLEAFKTADDLVLALKRRSMKRGVGRSPWPSVMAKK
jgi:hypothetical protein